MSEWRETRDTFVNPYNFVSLGNINNISREDAEQITRGDLTGVIKCSLKTVTPLAIPDSEKKVEDSQAPRHYIYPFFKVKEKEVIPGSEIRGMIRSVYEAVTNSCMAVINTNILSTRHPFPRKPGLIKYDQASGNWELYPATKYMLNTTRGNPHGTFYNIITTNGKWHIIDSGRSYYTGSVINFTSRTAYTKTVRGHTITIGPIVDRIDIRGALQGYLLLWEDIKGKHHNSIFQPVNGATAISCVNLKKAVENFHEVCKTYENNDEKYKNVTYKLKKDGSFNPVWYEEVSSGGHNHVYLSPACISRTVFDKRLEELIGNHKKCAGRNNLCPACLLFGMIGETSLGSSLRFSDAVLKAGQQNISLGSKTLKTLAGPKTSAVEFYTERPGNALTWNYDYITTDYIGRGIPSPERSLTDIKIRGRKFYLHDLQVNSDESKYTTTDKKEHNSTIELVKTGASFDFDVYFENITLTQLQFLVWTLTFGNNETDGNMCHKLGHGKPLGLGSVKITANSVITRTVEISEDNKLTFAENPANIANLINCNITPPRELIKIADINFTKDVNVSYPLADDHRNSLNSKSSHQWFAANRNMGVLPGGNQATGMKHSINYILPSISNNSAAASALALHKLENIEPDDTNVWTPSLQNDPEIKLSTMTIIDSANQPPPPKQIERDFTANEINTAYNKFNDFTKKSEKPQNKTILDNFVKAVKETDPDYPKWKDLLIKVKKVLK